MFLNILIFFLSIIIKSFITGKVIQLHTTILEDGICLDENNNTKCCTGYIYSEKEERCVECVGRFSNNCTQECLEGYYGASCESKCDCSKETCHKKRGCLKGPQSETNGVCYDKETGAKCCVNYMYLEDEHRCKECEGRFGENCSEECPEGYYGKQCREKCICPVSHCDNVLGCLTVTSESPELKNYQQTKFDSIFHTTLPALPPTVVFLVGCVFGIIYRCTRKHTGQVTAAADTTTNMENENDGSSSSYAVIRPKREAVADLQQNNIYKGTQNVKDLKSLYSTGSEVEEVYDDIACSALSGQSVPERHSSSEFDYSSTENYDFTEYIDVVS